MAEAESKAVLIAGASGFVGGYLLQALLEIPALGRVYAVSRRPLTREHPRLANRIVQFDALESQLKGLSSQVALCCLGTTLRRAGSPEAFRKIDLDYVVAFGKAARAAGAQRLVVMSSAAANPESKNFYLRTKGEMEQALSALGFPALDIFQPGVLLGWRRQMRPLELAARLAMPLVNPLLRGANERYRGISAQTVALAMAAAAISTRKGTQRYTYSGIAALAARRRA